MQTNVDFWNPDCIYMVTNCGSRSASMLASFVRRGNATSLTQCNFYHNLTCDAVCKHLLHVHKCTYAPIVVKFYSTQAAICKAWSILHESRLIWICALMLQAPPGQFKATQMGCVYVTYLRLTNSSFFFLIWVRMNHVEVLLVVLSQKVDSNILRMAI